MEKGWVSECGERTCTAFWEEGDEQRARLERIGRMHGGLLAVCVKTTF